jgi:hypothetical protein
MLFRAEQTKRHFPAHVSTLDAPQGASVETLPEKNMGNQINRQDENQRKPQPQQAENQGRQDQQDGTQKAKSAKKDRDMGQQNQPGQGRSQPDQDAGSRH